MKIKHIYFIPLTFLFCLVFLTDSRGNSSEYKDYTPIVLDQVSIKAIQMILEIREDLLEGGPTWFYKFREEHLPVVVVVTRTKTITHNNWGENISLSTYEYDNDYEKLTLILKRDSFKIYFDFFKCVVKNNLLAKHGTCEPKGVIVSYGELVGAFEKNDKLEEVLGRYLRSSNFSEDTLRLRGLDEELITMSVAAINHSIALDNSRREQIAEVEGVDLFRIIGLVPYEADPALFFAVRPDAFPSEVSPEIFGVLPEGNPALSEIPPGQLSAEPTTPPANLYKSVLGEPKFELIE